MTKLLAVLVVAAGLLAGAWQLRDAALARDPLPSRARLPAVAYDGKPLLPGDTAPANLYVTVESCELVRCREGATHRLTVHFEWNGQQPGTPMSADGRQTCVTLEGNRGQVGKFGGGCDQGYSGAISEVTLLPGEDYHLCFQAYAFYFNTDLGSSNLFCVDIPAPDPRL